MAVSGTRARRRRLPSAVGHVMGIALLVTALGMVASGFVEAAVGGTEVGVLFGSGIGIGFLGLLLWRTTYPPRDIPRASVFAAVLASWLAVSLAGAVPFLWSGVFDRFDLALFESVSGFTTTGSTVLRPIEGVSQGILFWRSMTQWFGGIGVVVLAVSVLSYLGIGGMELLKSEAPGPTAERLAPRVRETARRLVTLYLGFTVVVATAYAAFGMGPYDAAVHAFTTVSTGGFSPWNASFAHFDSGPLEWVAIAAMLFAGASFAMWWQALTGRPTALRRSPEFRAYLLIVGSLCAAAVGWNVAIEGFSLDLVRRVIFSTISISSSTGYTSLDYDTWSPALRLALLFAMGLGGMSGSTTGGFKVFRLLAILSYGRRQTFRQLHPRAVSVVRFGHQVVPEALLGQLLGFFALFMAAGALATFLVAASGADIPTATSAVAQAMGNVGPGLGAVGPTTDYLGLAPLGRDVVMVMMLVGRLEVFPVLLGMVWVLRAIGDRLPARVSQRAIRAFRG